MREGSGRDGGKDDADGLHVAGRRLAVGRARVRARAGCAQEELAAPGRLAAATCCSPHADAHVLSFESYK